jgi:hypothetical protein
MAELTIGLSDKALSVFVFAAYHELVSGQKVASVIRRDYAGHVADPEGVVELERRGFITQNGDFLHSAPRGNGSLRRCWSRFVSRPSDNVRSIRPGIRFPF